MSPARASSSSDPAASPPAAGAADGPSGGLDLPAGTVVEPGTLALWSALKEVLDPELPISVVDLGIIYAIRRDGGRVDVDLTFTAMACPCMDFIQDDVRERLLREPGVESVEIRVIWDPPWTRERMTETGWSVLRRYGVAA